MMKGQKKVHTMCGPVSGSGARTYDIPDMSRVLYQLSYAAITFVTLSNTHKSVKWIELKDDAFSAKLCAGNKALCSRNQAVKFFLDVRCNVVVFRIQTVFIPELCKHPAGI